MEENEIEKKKRFDLVLGVIIASVVGFLVNLSANLYYDFFIVETLTWEKVDHNQIYGIGLLFLLLFGFLQFFIYDYKNDVEVNRSFVKRFVNYFFFSFTPGKIIRVIIGLYLLFLSFGIVVAFGVFLVKSIGYLWTAAFIIVFLLLYFSGRKR